MLCLCAALLFAACGNIPGAPAEEQSAAVQAAGEDRDEASAVKNTLAGGAEISGSGASSEENTLTISEAGTYLLSGSFEGQLVVDADKDDTVRLVLNGMFFTCADSAPVYVKQAGETSCLLPRGRRTPSRTRKATSIQTVKPMPDIAVFTKDDLTINGAGALEVTGNYRNGITSKDYFTVTGGDIRVTAVHGALRRWDGVTVTSGVFTLDAGADGIKLNNDEDPEKGFVTLAGGTFTINAGDDGILAETALEISGGSYVITCGGGSALAEPRRTRGFGGGRGMRPDGQSAPATSGEAPAAQTSAVQAAAEPAVGTQADSASAETENTSAKGPRAGTALTISGGTFTIDSLDDSIHSNGDAEISGGEFTLFTGDDGMHADGGLLVSGSTMEIATSYEGLEGAKIP